MRPSTIALAVGLLAAPLSLFTQAAPAAADGAIPSPFDPASVIPAQAVNRYGRFTDAPVSSLSDDNVAPADRAAQPGTRSFDAGPINGTPFSDTPTGTLSDGGTQVSKGDRALDPGNVTPNLGK